MLRRFCRGLGFFAGSIYCSVELRLRMYCKSDLWFGRFCVMCLRVSGVWCETACKKLVVAFVALGPSLYTPYSLSN